MDEDEKLEALYRGKLQGHFTYSNEDIRIVLDSCNSNNGILVYHFRQIEPPTNRAIMVSMPSKFQRDTKRARNLAARDALHTIIFGPYEGEEDGYIPPQQERESIDRRKTA